MIIKLLFPFAVKPHQSVRKGKYRFYQTGGEFKKAVILTAKTLLPVNFVPYEKTIPLYLKAAYFFKYPKRFGKKITENAIIVPRVTKPDLTDNTQKLLVDSLAGIVFEQDQQITKFEAEKYWGPKDRILLSFIPVSFSHVTFDSYLQRFAGVLEEYRDGSESHQL